MKSLFFCSKNYLLAIFSSENSIHWLIILLTLMPETLLINSNFSNVLLSILILRFTEQFCSFTTLNFPMTKLLHRWLYNVTKKTLQFVTTFVVSWQNLAQKKTAIKYRSLNMFYNLFFTIAILQLRQLLHYL